MIPLRLEPRALRLPRSRAEARSAMEQLRLYFGLRLDPRQRRRFRLRARLAHRHLRGHGLEIGALHSPLPLPPGADARYLDRMPMEELRREYAYLSLLRLAPVTVVDDGERLERVEPESLDFLVASHVIEHCRDPIGTLQAWLRVLRPGGVLFLVVPDRTNRYDRHRPLTSLEHVVRDFEEGPDASQPEHYAEWLARDVPAPELTPARVQAAVREASSIHQHVWTLATFRELLEHCRAWLGLALEVEAAESSFEEFLVVARRRGAGGS